MARQMNTWVTLITPGRHETLPLHKVQVNGVTRTATKADAAKAFGMSLYEFNQYAHTVAGPQPGFAHSVPVGTRSGDPAEARLDSVATPV